VNRIAVATVLVGALGAMVAAQEPKPRFEVASIREVPGRGGNPPVPRPLTLRVLPERVEIRNAALHMLILLAFDIPRNPLSQIDWPAWLRPNRDEKLFDIQATMPAASTRQQLPAMLRTLLSERFHLVTHTELRPVPAFELVVKSGGPKMREVEPLDELSKEFPTDGSLRQRVIVDNTSTPFVTRSLIADNLERIVAAGDGIRVLTTRTMYRTSTTDHQTQLVEATRMTMAELAHILQNGGDKPVIDKTGLSGLYQFTIEIPPFGSPALDAAVASIRNGEPIQRDPSPASLFKAVESLGLKLEERRSPLEVLIVDKVETTPTEN